MAKITKVTFYRKGFSEVADLTCSTKGVFQIKFPENIAKIIETDFVDGTNAEEVVSEWKRLLEVYCEAMTSYRKVILFQIEINAKIQDTTVEYYIERIKRDDIAFAKGMALGVQAGVYEEKKVVTVEKTTYSYTLIKSEIPYSVHFYNIDHVRSETSVHIIDWSQEHEDFLARFCISFENLIMRIADFTKSKDNFLLFLQSGASPMLPAPGEE